MPSAVVDETPVSETVKAFDGVSVPALNVPDTPVSATEKATPKRAERGCGGDAGWQQRVGRRLGEAVGRSWLCGMAYCHPMAKDARRERHGLSRFFEPDGAGRGDAVGGARPQAPGSSGCRGDVGPRLRRVPEDMGIWTFQQ